MTEISSKDLVTCLSWVLSPLGTLALLTYLVLLENDRMLPKLTPSELSGPKESTQQLKDEKVNPITQEQRSLSQGT